LTREIERVEKDVRSRLVSIEKARTGYGVLIDPKTLRAEKTASEELRAEMKARRGEPKPFDFGPPLQEILRRCREETGLEPPKPPVFKKHRTSMPIFKPKPSNARLVPKEIAGKLLAKAAGRGSDGRSRAALSRRSGV
jgi:hypothetical protein